MISTIMVMQLHWENVEMGWGERGWGKGREGRKGHKRTKSPLSTVGSKKKKVFNGLKV